MHDEREEPRNGLAVGGADPPPPGRTGNVGGNDGADEVLREMQEYCDGREKAHRLTARWRNLRNTWLAAAAVVLSAILAVGLFGTAVGSTAETQDPAQEKTPAQEQDAAEGGGGSGTEEPGTTTVSLPVQWIAGIVALLSAVATGLQKVFNEAETAGKHDGATAIYRDVNRDITIAKARSPEEQLEAAKEIDALLDQLEKEVPRPHEKYLQESGGVQRVAVHA